MLSGIMTEILWSVNRIKSRHNDWECNSEKLNQIVLKLQVH